MGEHLRQEPLQWFFWQFGENRSGDKSPEFARSDYFAIVELSGSTNAGTQETSVVFQTHLAAGEKIRYCCHRLFAAPRAGTYCQDQITQ
jgi:hypothetical protein